MIGEPMHTASKRRNGAMNVQPVTQQYESRILRKVCN